MDFQLNTNSRRVQVTDAMFCVDKIIGLVNFVEAPAISRLSAFSQKQSTSMHLNEWGFMKTVLKSDNSINATSGLSNAGVNITFNNQYSFNQTPYVLSIVAAGNSWERHPLDNSTQVFNLQTLLAS